MATTTTGGSMPPQATQAPQSQEDREKAARAQAEKDWLELVGRATEGDSPAARQIKRAIRLEAERGALMERVSANREYLRLMDKNEELTEDQAEFLDTFYAEKSKGDRRGTEDQAATRLARSLARKNGGTEA